MLKEDYGLVGDGHADRCTHGQVSLLPMESVDKMSKLGLVRGRPITIHAHAWRITSDERQGC